MSSCSEADATVSAAPSETAAESLSYCMPSESYAVPNTRGACSSAISSANTSNGTTQTT